MTGWISAVGVLTLALAFEPPGVDSLWPQPAGDPARDEAAEAAAAETAGQRARATRAWAERRVRSLQVQIARR